jgi:acyl carrier protein
MENKLFAVFKDALDLSDDIDRATLKYNETEGWDSLAHMRIVAGIEDAFDCMLETNEILDMSSFEVAITIVQKYA